MNFWPKKLHMFLSRLNEISEGCERDSRKRFSERSLRKLWAFTNRLTYGSSIFSSHYRLFCLLPFKCFATRGKNSYVLLSLRFYPSFVFIPLYSKWSNSKVEVGLLGREIAFYINLLFDYFPLLQSEFGNKMGNGFFLKYTWQLIGANIFSTH